MIDFIEYVVAEIRSKRLSKENALSLIRQFSLNTSSGKTAALHPLLHRNTSSIEQQCYSSSFSGEEFFLNDHQIIADGGASKVLPGVAYLEMARAAMKDAMPHLSSTDQVRLSDVVWLKPIVVGEQQEVCIRLLPGEDAKSSDDLELEFEVFTPAPEEVVHCRGRATWTEHLTPEKLDLASIKARMSARAFDAAAIYPAYRKMGMQFGPAHQPLNRICIGEREVLAELSLPASVSGTLADFQLHPSLLDGALQASIGLAGDLNELPSQPALPFALQSLEAFSDCKATMYAWIRHSSDFPVNENVSRLHIDLCDEHGNVCVRLKGFSSRIFGSRSSGVGLFLASPVWKAQAITQTTKIASAQHHVLLCDLPGLSVESLPNARIQEIRASSTGTAERFSETALACFKAVKDILPAKALIQIVATEEFAALSGLLKSAALENPQITGQLVLVDKSITAEDLSTLLQAEAHQTRDAIVRYDSGIRQTLSWEEYPADASAAPGAFKEGGVYLITGGLGALGKLFARDILEQTTNAKVVLTGRAPLSPDLEAQVIALGNRAEYRSLDVTDELQVRNLIADVVAMHGRLDGIIHSAGMIADNFISRKSPEEFAAVLAPKIFGAVNLQLASAELDLEFLALFSSGAALMGNVGQADYAVANAFMDAFASKRSDRTFSINWPLWQDGGMQMSAADQEAMRELTGMQAMDTRTGLEAFHRILHSQQPQTAVVQGELAKIRRTIFNEPAPEYGLAEGGSEPSRGQGAQAGEWRGQAQGQYVQAGGERGLAQGQYAQIGGERGLAQAKHAQAGEGLGETSEQFARGESARGGTAGDIIAPAGERLSAQSTSEQTRDYLRQQFSGLFKLPAARIDPRAPLEKYGIDSILAMDLTRQLEKTFGSLSKTLFFEHQTIDELTEYFVQSHAAVLETLFKVETRPSPAPAAPPQQATRKTVKRRLTRDAQSTVTQDEPIAIVGLSGRYPESPDIEAFWNNLRDGKDCITEIPRDRWDWREYYSEDRTTEGRHFSKWGGFIQGVDEFDPLFFSIAPSEAGMMDPQERLFLQHTWRAIEDAGYTRASLQAPHESGLAGQVGVYVGVMYGEYQLFGAESSLRGKRIGVPVSYASIANRVSYVLNLHGPSMTLDTMCSSSLTAIHLACLDLKQGRTSLAIAGGVNVTIHPNKYLILSAGQFISSDGHCQSFGEGGDGYIPGEGVGVVVLKRLSEAERDGNPIYGLIRGSALNHGGKTNGYSVPNPKAQAGVIAQALHDGKVDPRHISYIEAHGTGTKLGDPIEIAALTQAFRRHTQDNQFCALGSAKSNIGHCESAAGIAGLTKVLLQMKHGVIAPSLHSSRLNPHIDFAATPFVVNQSLKPWDAPEVSGKKLPRIAGISSFGAGGSNAHLIIEEYRPSTIARSRVDGVGPQIIALSARTTEQLEQKARDLLAFIELRDRNVDLLSMAYTLQLGRETMDVRAAFVVESVTQLTEKLEGYTRGERNLDGVFEGRVDRNTDGMSSLGQDEEMREAIDKWIARGKLTKLADLWVKGLELDWRKLHGERRPPFISLPAYPFARERYWIAPATSDTAAQSLSAPVLHPLLHTNTADFFQQSYTSVFSGNEFFLSGHEIETNAGARQKVLPAVAYLEMVRASLDLAWPSTETRAFELRNAAWSQPLVVDSPKQVSLALLPGEEGHVDFEICSREPGAAEPNVHCEGQAAIYNDATLTTLDIENLKAQMTRGAIDGAEIYAAFRSMGMHYGAAFQCITAIHRGQDQLIAELKLPGMLEAQHTDYLLHPSLADAALQASLGLVDDLNHLPARPAIPFALDTLRILALCASSMFAWVRRSNDSKIDIDLCDTRGKVCAQLLGLTTRALKTQEIGTLLAQPMWEPAPEVSAKAAYDRHEVILCNLPSLDLQQFEGMSARHLPYAPTESIAERYRAAAVACFEHLQSLLKSKPAERTLFQLVMACDAEDAVLAGLSGLIRTARLENTKLVGQLIVTSRSVDERALTEQLKCSANQPGEAVFNYAQGTAQVQRWKPIETRELVEPVVFKNDGVYLITGGLGGLGTVFAREILKRAPSAKVVLTGRSELTDEKWRALQQLSAELSVDTHRLTYGQLDLDAPEAVERFIEDLTKRCGGLNGVLHSAGMIQDRLIVNKTADEFAQVLAPKVAGTVNLDRATRTLDLEFFVLFSSVASAMGNAGQADYAAANGFMDRFAGYRNSLVEAGERRGRTLSINWPLWEDGGMHLDPQAQEALLRGFGIVPMKTATGLEALHNSLGLQLGQTLVLEGHVERLRGLFAPQAAVVDVEEPVDVAGLVQTTQGWLTTQFSDLLKIAAHEIEPKAQLERYGIDSVLAMKLTQRLEETFGSLSKTLFFEHQTLASLAGYLAKAFPKVVQEKVGGPVGGRSLGGQVAGAKANVQVDEHHAGGQIAGSETMPMARLHASNPGAAANSVVSKAITPNGTASKAIAKAIAPKGIASKAAATSQSRASLPTPISSRFARPSAARAEIDVAIVGLGGKFPQAKNLEEFWENLKNGRDCITEVPRDRWDSAQLYHPERNQAGKTYSKWGGFLDGVDQFDPLFFNISPREAQLIDPQERLFLETVWETIEDAGYSKDSIARNRVGVFVGAMWGQYELFGVASPESGVPSSSFASIANRISYFFNFHGPSMAVDTMCSSSLTAIHLACEEIRKGSVDVAIAGGVNVSIHPAKYLSLSQGNFAASDGRCRSFGAGGDGYVPGEGVGAVLLKPLHQALADGDQVYAIVKASTINHGGKTNGYTVPNPLAQSDLIAEAITKAGIDPATISYIETHGTGTSLGDPIEIAGLVKAFESASKQGSLDRKQFCPIGSVKSNIGHLESAAGIAAVAKSLLQLKHQQLVPSLHAEPANPNIDFSQTPFYVQTQLADWKRPENHPRRIAISSFGAGGSNAHLILEEVVASSRSHAPNQPEAFVLSAKTRHSLQAYAQRMLSFLDSAPQISLTDLAFTSQVGRTPMQERLVVIASSVAMLQEKLTQWLRTPSETVENVFEGSTRDSKSNAPLLIEGEAGEAFIQVILENRDLSKLAKLWIGGVDIDWAQLHRSGPRPQRISLPTYPFVKERYWIDAPAFSAVTAEPREPTHVLHYEPEWRGAEISGGALPEGPLLILDSQEELFKQLKSGETRSVLVKYGAKYEQLADDVFTVDPHSESDLSKLVEAVHPRLVVQNCHPGSVQDLYALHHLCKAMMKQKPAQNISLVSIGTRSPLHSALSGFFKTLALENPLFAGRVVTVDGAADIGKVALAELREANGRDVEVRYVPQRQLKQLKRHAPSAAAAKSSHAAFKEKGVYLVTGGLGGLGYLFSEYLVKHYHCKLALIGRSALSSEQQRKLASLKGAQYLQADVCDTEQLDAAVRNVKVRFGKIDGVIHSAGIHRDALILNKTQDEIEAVLAAKVTGTINLDRATRGEKLDVFVMFSSVAAALGNPGQSDYAFANSFMDAFAEQRDAMRESGERSGRTLSINWPFWEEGGMQIAPNILKRIEEQSGVSPLPTREGIQFLEDALRAEGPQAMVLYGVQSKIDTAVLRPSAPVESSTSLQDKVEQYLTALLSQEIKLSEDRIDPRESFASFGVDSMMINRINTRLASDLGELPQTLLYQHDSVEALAKYLVAEAAPAVAGYFKAPVAESAVSVAARVAPVEESAGDESIRVVPVAESTGDESKRAALAESTADEAARAVRIAEHTADEGARLAQVATGSLNAISASSPIAPNAPQAMPSRRPEQSAPFQDESIAIVGMHCQFPHSKTPKQFWDNLLQGKDLIDPVPSSRWDAEALEESIYCKWGGFLDDVDQFDPAFFSISQADARLMDPQERLFLQSVWSAIEDAGYTRESLKKRFPKANSADVGVFVGVTTNSYNLLGPDDVTPGAMPWSLANRVSYFFDFKGPSVPIDTACSSSLVAMHQACESLRRGECQVAIAGGVNLYLHPAKYQSLCSRRMLAQGSQNRSFGAGDDGFIPGEGVGSLVLKPLSLAIEHGDHIYGVIAASSVEHSGRSNGYGAPNPTSQGNLVERTLSKRNLSAESIGYVEGHGTGTQLGDSLEVASLTAAFRRSTSKKQFCPIGSVKANIGHAESAAGIAGVAKILLQLQHAQIAPTIHSTEVNPDIAFDTSPFYLQHKAVAWESNNEQPRRAMINSFGAGGVNSCVILEEYKAVEAVPSTVPKDSSLLFVLSARNEDRLRESASRLSEYLQAKPEIDLASLAYTLQAGREAMPERWAVVASTRDELIKELDAVLQNKTSANALRGRIEPKRRKKQATPQGDWRTVAQMWIEGVELNWDELYQAEKPRKISLPTYPFAKERYWIADAVVSVSQPQQRLHPLVDRNVSTLQDVCFSSELSADQYYARDHKVSGESFFPGAGFLEMACVSGTIAGEQKVVAIRDIVWNQPLRFAAPSQLVKSFLKANGNDTEYVIVSLDEDNERVVHSEGRLVYAASEEKQGSARETVCIDSLKARCTKTLPGSQCYANFDRFGLQYGPCFQTIQELHIGRDFALAKLKLADALAPDFDQYILHPSLIDGALQAVVGLAGEGSDHAPYLPFALDEVEILQSLPATCYAYVEPASREPSSHPQIKQFNIRLLSESGATVARLSKFYVRAYREKQPTQDDAARPLRASH